MNTAGIGISSNVAGIPYLIIVRVGLQFPSTKSLIRITDDLKEYNIHLAKMGIATVGNENNTNNNNKIGTPIVQRDNSTFMYIIIGLLGLIIVLLLLFLIKKQKSKSALLLFLIFDASAM
jgi:LPXTG-motif cell wall-anchored protein